MKFFSPTTMVFLQFIHLYSVLGVFSGCSLIRHSVSCHNIAGPLTVVICGGNVDGNNRGGNGHITEGNVEPHREEYTNEKGCFDLEFSGF